MKIKQKEIRQGGRGSTSGGGAVCPPKKKKKATVNACSNPLQGIASCYLMVLLSLSVLIVS